MAASLERFSFREFGDGAPGEKMAAGKPFMRMGKSKTDAPDAPPPPPTFSEEQLKAAERESYKKGFLDGVQDGRKQAETEQADTDRKLSEAVEIFAQKLAPLVADYRRMVQELKEQSPKIALAIARKVADKALDDNASAVITDVAVRACETMTGEPKIDITVHDSIAKALAYRLQQLASRLPDATAIEIVSDPDMPSADCRIEWNYGSMERNTEQLWQQVERAIENRATSVRRDTEEQLDLLLSSIAQSPASLAKAGAAGETPTKTEDKDKKTDNGTNA